MNGLHPLIAENLAAGKARVEALKQQGVSGSAMFSALARQMVLKKADETPKVPAWFEKWWEVEQPFIKSMLSYLVTGSKDVKSPAGYTVGERRAMVQILKAITAAGKRYDSFFLNEERKNDLRK